LDTIANFEWFKPMRKNLPLYLVTVYLLSLVIMVTVAGYLVPGDSLYVTAGEHEQKITGFWLQWDGTSPAEANRREKVAPRKAFLHYRADSCHFFASPAVIRASLLKVNEKVADLFEAPFKLSSRAPPAL
jgi:hypothetical protein